MNTLLKIVYVFLIAFTFSPIVLRYNEIQPTVLGLPRVLWISMLISIGFVFLTVLGSIFLEREK